LPKGKIVMSRRNSLILLISLFVISHLIYFSSCGSGDGDDPPTQTPTSITPTPTPTEIPTATATWEPGTLHQNAEFLWDGKMRKYHFFVPGGNLPSPRPLLLLLHGGGGDIDHLIGLSGELPSPFAVWLEVADANQLYLAIPQGENKHWNDCRTDCTHCGDEDDTGFINELINRMEYTYNLDSERIYVTGVSNGGLMSFRLAFELSNRIAAVACIISALPENNECSALDNPISILIMNGTEDYIIPWNGGQSAIAGTGSFLSTAETVSYWIGHNQCQTDSDYYEFPDGPENDHSTVNRHTYSHGEDNSEVVLYTVSGGGHTEPSIVEQFPTWWELIVGWQNHDIEMAQEVWDFLKRQSLSIPY